MASEIHYILNPKWKNKRDYKIMILNIKGLTLEKA